ncbi:MAG: 30S ribosome-binding factor RbfA [Planctomycetota bacterium]|nr:30S ribosome-binding factor RbfA [Planctomycetota bacterium]
MPRESHRIERVARELQREVAGILLNETADQRLRFVSVTRVELSPDLRFARIYVSVLGDESTRESCMGALRRAKRFVQSRVNARFKMRYVPVISFHSDSSIAGAIDICKLIDSVVPKETPGEEESEEVAEEGHAEVTEGEREEGGDQGEVEADTKGAESAGNEDAPVNEEGETDPDCDNTEAQDHTDGAGTAGNPGRPRS